MENSKPTEMIAKLILLATTQDAKEKQQLIKEIADISNEESRDEWERLLKFTDKEISKMPKYFKKEFRTNGLRAHIRKRKRGNSINYEIRCRSKGFDISASGITIELAKGIFFEKLNNFEKNKVKTSLPTKFNEIALYYFENYRIRKVKNITYQKDKLRLKNHLLPYFGELQPNAITADLCQKLIDKYTNEGKGKTAEELFSLLNGLFKYEIANGIITRNPLDTIIHETHERKHGKALSKQDEAKLLAEARDDRKLYFALILYTGLRPNEYKTLEKHGNMLKAINSKRKNNAIEYKRIPINPMLAPYTENLTHFEFPSEKTIYRNLKKILPNAKPYDLRTTFYTRCQECHVAEVARKVMVGHSLGKLANTYTDLSDDFLLQESQKINYVLPPICPQKE